jgi:monofunctional biosynthetic peptidoglycan transglycosylase
MKSESALARFRMAEALARVVSARFPSWPRALSRQGRDAGESSEDATRVEAGDKASVRLSHPEGRFRVSPPRRLVPRILRGIALSVLALHAWYIVTTSLLIFIYKFCDPPATVIMVYRAVLYRWKLVAPKPVPLKKIPAYVRSMLVAVEDGKFYSHHGLDFEAFKRARQINAIVGKPLYGGSTLTMQVARTLFLVPEKSYIRKYFEIIAALELEAILGKDRILEFYFDYAEWGRGIFGIEAAARAYYRKPLASLSRDEAARLIALLSSPIKYNPANLQRSPILRERYAYLSRRYVTGEAQPPDRTPELQPPPQGIEPSVLDADAPSPEEPTGTEGAGSGDPAIEVAPAPPPEGGVQSPAEATPAPLPENGIPSDSSPGQ